VKWLKHVVPICESQPIVRTREKGGKREGERNLREKKTFTESQKWVSSSLRAGTEKRSVFSTPYLGLRDARPELSGKGTGLERILRALRTPGSPSSAVFFPPFTTASLPLPGRLQNWLCSRKWRRHANHNAERGASSAAAAGEWSGVEEPRVGLHALQMPVHVSLPWEAGLLCGSPVEKQL